MEPFFCVLQASKTMPIPPPFMSTNKDRDRDRGRATCLRLFAFILYHMTIRNTPTSRIVQA